VFGKKLVNEGIISEDEMHSFIEQVQKELRQAVCEYSDKELD
jgi:2-oxoglutarate dehydrogenase E1 component